MFRVATTLISAIATLYFVFWVGGALLFRVGTSFRVSWVVSLAAACVVAWFVWIQMASVQPGLVKAIVLGAVVTGAVAFSVGFFGPIIFMPGANQGPLTGFIIGPFGVVIGAVGGAVYWLVKRRRGARLANNAAG